MSIRINTTSLQELLAQANALPAEKVIQSSKSVEPSQSAQTVVPDAGYDAIETVTVGAIPEQYIDTSDATATASSILSGDTAYANGEKITGTIETKTSSDLTASGATVSVPAGYYSAQASKSVATATQATPTVSIDSAGKITATSTQAAGYVSAGTKTGTKQLTTQAAKTVTPTKSEQTAVASGVYTTGAIKVAAIPSKYQDVSGVTATASGTLSGQKFVNSSGTVVTGTMPNNGSTSKTIDGLETKTVSIPLGYTSGGTVTVDDTVDNIADEQADLLSQIQVALEGKAGGNSNETNIKTVEVYIYGVARRAFATILSDGIITSIDTGDITNPELVLSNVAVGSVLAVFHEPGMSVDMESSVGCTLLYNNNDDGVAVLRVEDSEHGSALFFEVSFV